MIIEKRGHQSAFTGEVLLEATLLRSIFDTLIKAATIGAQRRSNGYVVEKPSAKDLAEWEAADALYQQLRESRFWDDGRDGGLAERPAPRKTPVYTETEDEFAARVDREYAEFATKIKNGEWPL